MDESNKEICKCGNEKCTGFYLLHPKEMCKIPELKKKELEEDSKCTFNLMVSPSSGEIFTVFHELHVIGSKPKVPVEEVVPV
jgi:hypothetical protein